MIRPIDIRLNAAHPELPLAEAVTFTGSPSTVLIRGVPPNCGRWAITAVFVAASFPDGSTTTRAAVQSANGVWVATLPATATSGRTASGIRIMADGVDENGEAVTGYILGVADFAVASLGVAPAPEPGETSYQMLYFDEVPSTLRKGDVAKIDGVLKFHNGTAWEPFAAPITLDDTVTSSSANGVKSSGIWSAIWGALSALPSGFSSLYDWCVSQLAGKLDKSGGTMTGTLILNSATGSATIGVIIRNSESGSAIAFSSNRINLSVGNNRYEILYPLADGTFALAASNPTAGNLAALDANGNPTDSTIPAANVAVKGEIPYILVTKTISNNAVTLDDRASNAVTISTTLSPNTLTINFPTAPTSGKVRDFSMRLNIAAGVTAPEIAWPQGVTLENDGGEVPEIADGGTGGSSTILYFSETENNGTTAKFLVKSETLAAITQA